MKSTNIEVMINPWSRAYKLTLTQMPTRIRIQIQTPIQTQIQILIPQIMWPINDQILEESQ
jgi:hypothetical protein